MLAATERRLKFRGLPQAVGAARRALRQWEHHFEPDLFYDLSLCVSELVTNAIQRVGRGGDESESLCGAATSWCAPKSRSVSRTWS